jgi:protein gp37
LTAKTEIAERLGVIEKRIEQNFRVMCGGLLEIRNERLYRARGFTTFEEYCQKRWGLGRNYVNKQIAAAAVIQNLGTVVPNPLTERQARELVRLPPEQQREVAAKVDFTNATAADVRAVVEHFSVHAPTVTTGEGLKVLQPERKKRRTFLVEEWKTMSPEERLAALSLRDPKAQFNLQDNESVGWARYTTNPERGCEIDCPYCYARDLARFYPEGFAPVFVPEILSAAANTLVPKEAEYDVSYRNVFVCSMGDLFGNWVPDEWIEAVLKMARENPQWNFLFLTKVPQRMAEFEFPDNAWAGTTVDHQRRVRNAEQAMAKVKAGKRWASIEPMETRIEMDFSIFDWVVIGGASKSSQTPQWVPPHVWVYETTIKAKAAGCAVYHKSNLFLAEPLHEFPGVFTVERQLPKEFGLGLVQIKI